MEKQVNYLDYKGLKTYDKLIKEYIDNKEISIEEFTDVDVLNDKQLNNFD